MDYEMRLSFITGFLWIIAVCLTLSVFLSTMACASSTSPKSVKFSGTVILYNDTQDSSFDVSSFEDVIVAIYKTVEPDSSLARLNREFPLIGVKATQEVIFDHRLYAPEAVVKTDELGNFVFPNLREGRYNLFAFKDNWGGQYILDINIAKDTDGEYVLEDDISLYPELYIPHFVDNNFKFLSSHVYRFEQDSVVFSEITIHSGALLLIDPGVKVNFIDSALSVNGDGYWKITSSDSYYSTERKEDILPFSYVKFSGSSPNTHLKNLIFDYSTDGLSVNTENFTIENCVFKSNISYALNIVCNDGLIKNCLFWENPMKGLEAKNSITIDKSLFVNNKDACRIFECEGLIQNNYFYGNWFGLRPFLSNIEIKNNNFDNNHVAIPLCASDPVIMFNNFFKNELDVELNNYYIQQSAVFSNPSVQNNFYTSDIYVKFAGTNSIYGATPPGVNQDQHYPQNYWKESNPYDKIMDGNYPGADFTYILNIIPRSISKIAGAGIQ